MFHGSSRAPEGGLFLTSFISESPCSQPHLLSKYFEFPSYKRKKKEFITSFSSAGRKSGIPSVLVWFLDLLQGRTFYFKVHVVFMLCLVGAPRPLLVVASVSSECRHLKTRIIIIIFSQHTKM